VQTELQTSTSSYDQTDVKQKAEETASTIATQAQQVATTQLNSQKERAASTLDAVAQSLSQASDSMRDQQPQIASIADQAVTRINDASTYVREHDLRDFVSETEQFARREPLMFLGGAFAIGFAAARFLKASSPTAGNAQQRSWDSGRVGSSYGAGYSGGMYDGGLGYAGAQPRSGFANGSGAADYAPADSAAGSGIDGIVPSLDESISDNIGAQEDVYGGSTALDGYNHADELGASEFAATSDPVSPDFQFDDTAQR
jgi:ElaB/YqjD/DUF883 family membrane-anchored ribosome-binding protein